MSTLIKDSNYGERGTEALRQWYEDGADGQINWGEDGDFEACVAIAGKYIDNPEGYCNERHQAATGAPPGHAPGEEDAKKASKWSEHPNHALHDKITEHYAPLIAAALKDSITGAKAAITSAQNKYASAKAKTKKAAGDDVATGETLAQQIARQAAASGIGTSQAELKQLLTQMTSDSWLAGIRSAITQVPGATVPPDLQDIYDAVDWDAWSPGNAAAADTITSSGFQAVLDQMGATLDGITQTNVERIGNAIADGLTSGDSVQTIAASIGDAVGGEDDSRALMIANTQAGMAMSSASMDTYQTNGIEQYAWLSEDDACPECQDNADNSPYDVGDDPDPSQPAHPNCRCAYIPIVPTTDSDDTSGDDNG